MSEHPLADVLTGTGAVVVLLDDTGHAVGGNPAALAQLGITEQELVGRDAVSLLARPRDVPGLRQSLRQVARTGSPVVLETVLNGVDDAPSRSMVWSLSAVPGPCPRVSAVGIDITSTRSELEELQNRALTDELTGLGNRAQLMLRLRQVSGSGATVLFCDLNGFKAVNDTYGHAAGDAVLVEVARRFTRAVRGEDLVVRLGGDEFVIVAPADPSFDAEGLHRRVVRAVRQPMLLSGGVMVIVGVAVGIARLAPGLDPETVLREADSAMYAAKAAR